jgi:hypothetical protein
MVPDYLEASIAHMLAMESKEYNLVDYKTEHKEPKPN